MGRHEPVFRDMDRKPEQQPPMRQQGDRWPDELEDTASGDGREYVRPSDLDGV